MDAALEGDDCEETIAAAEAGCVVTFVNAGISGDDAVISNVGTTGVESGCIIPGCIMPGCIMPGGDIRFVGITCECMPLADIPGGYIPLAGINPFGIIGIFGVL